MNMLRRVVLLPVTTTGAATLVLSLATAPGAHAAPGLAADAAAARPGVVRPGLAAAPARGLDISSYQHGRTPIDWRLLARHGISFVAVKVSEGTYYRNPYYQSDGRGAVTAGLAVMPYVFANPASAGGAPTARYAVRVTGSLRRPAQLPLVIDLENDPYKAAADCYGLNRRSMIRWIAGFVGQARALTGKWPVIYTGAIWWQECTGATSRFRRDPLWLAAFGGTRPAVPSTWRRWTFWQYNDAGRLPGIGPSDLDYYQPTGDLPALRPLPWPMSGARPASRARILAARRSATRPGPRVRHLVRHRGRP
jgi:GH25 family lysozyme M1 (1,4-beta-N-acetylmuramidase)